jgi:hypothetical protein
MTNYKMPLWIGVLIILLPFLGIPQSWKNLLFFTVGLLLIAIALMIRGEQRDVPAEAASYDDVPEPMTFRDSYASAERMHESVYSDAPTPHGYVAADAFAGVVAEDVDEVLATPKVKKARKKRVAVADVTPVYDEILSR